MGVVNLSSDTYRGFSLKLVLVIYEGLRFMGKASRHMSSVAPRRKSAIRGATSPGDTEWWDLNQNFKEDSCMLPNKRN